MVEDLADTPDPDRKLRSISEYEIDSPSFPEALNLDVGILNSLRVPTGLLGLPQSALSTVSSASSWIANVATSRMRDVA